MTRDPQKVADDVRLGYVSAESANTDYGVVLTADGTVDTAKTAKRRDGDAAT